MNHLLFIYEKYKDLLIKPCFRKCRVDNQFLIVINDRLEIFYLTDTAKEMIKTISDSIKVDDLFKIFQEEYEVDAITLKSDIIDFLKDMQWKGIICLNYLENSEVQ